MAIAENKDKLVFGLDIGTRSIVGTVGYLEGDHFIVVAERTKEHETRAMIDGQIHDIMKVGATIGMVKAELEEVIGIPLTEVCIAAAGRVLRTVTTKVEQEFSGEKEINEEDIYSLNAMGMESAYKEFMDDNDTEMKFYCVGYSIIRYFMNGYAIGNLEGHKAHKIGAELIATFLPEDVVDGLYKAVEVAGLKVANLTLEPIAAIAVAIPEMYRMLNIALVDVGAGTSDISLTRDGAVVAYGMIPVAGDSLTEIVARNCLVDFVTADQIKRLSTTQDMVEYKDIMGLPQTITKKQMSELLQPQVELMTKQVADSIYELNGDKPVSAVFVVGGGGRIDGYTESLARALGVPKERVAVRGEEVMNKIDFLEKDVVKDSLLVTPVGIALSYYEQSNNFIFVTFNKNRIKLYDNDHLAVVDAAMQSLFPNERLFPRRGESLIFQVNGKPRVARGIAGEAAQILVNGEIADIHTRIQSNDVIEVTESTLGEPAKLELHQLAEFGENLLVVVNGTTVNVPKFAKVGEELKSGYYEIQKEDDIWFLDYYTVSQLAEFLDLNWGENTRIRVNHVPANKDTKVYANFTVEWENANEDWDADTDQDVATHLVAETPKTKEVSVSDGSVIHDIMVVVNKKPITLKGKAHYVYVDVFDYIDFDLSKPQSAGIVTLYNGRNAEYMQEIESGDVIDIFWRKE